MPELTVIPKNEVYDQIACEDSIAQELYDYFAFKNPNADYMRRKSSRLKYWDGFIRLFTRKGHRLYRGLRSRIEKFAQDRGLSVEYIDENTDAEFSVYEAKEFIKTLNIPFEVRDYQIEAFIKAVRKCRLLTLSPTASGKSLIIYLLVRYLNLKTLIIVPTVNLVGQMVGHFAEYGSNLDIHQIFAGQQITTNKQITISTWQSIFDIKNFANQFDVVIVDEAHHAQADSIKGIMEEAVNVKHRYGFTGTLDELPVHRLILEGLFGEVHQVITTKDLINQGFIAPLNIKALILKYAESECRIVSRFDYDTELKYIVDHEKRKRYINNLVLSLEGNTIVLFRLVEKHGKILFEDLKRLLPKNRPIYYIAGSTPGDERNQIRAYLEKEKNAVLVGSYGCVSTGFDAPSLKHCIFASPYKSKIKVLQSIGRVLRKYKDQKCIVYDIVDDFSYKKQQNYVLNHFVERMKIYYQEQFNPKVYKVKLYD